MGAAAIECAACGTPNVERARFCRACGGPLGEEAGGGPGWRDVGRACAWVAAAGLCGGSLVLALVASHLTTPTPPTLPGAATAGPEARLEYLRELFAYRRAVLPQPLAAQALLLAGFVGLGLLGRPLRRLLGASGPVGELVVAAFGAGGLLGALGALLSIGHNSAEAALGARLVRLGAPDLATGLQSLDLTHQVLGGVTAALSGGSLAAVAAGALLAAVLARRAGAVPRSWVHLSLALAVTWALGAVGQVAAPAPTAAALLVLGGVVIAPAWAVVLARAFGRAA